MLLLYPVVQEAWPLMQPTHLQNMQSRPLFFWADLRIQNPNLIGLQECMMKLQLKKRFLKMNSAVIMHLQSK